jgi:hypothetical protein
MILEPTQDETAPEARRGEDWRLPCTCFGRDKRGQGCSTSSPRRGGRGRRSSPGPPTPGFETNQDQSLASATVRQTMLRNIITNQ